LEHYAKCYSLA